ncbi:hypothetical protein ACFQI7_00900 [Paenibacillus allorhizosphaerae]|uniref:Extracellular solute-binding protein n=1 Tax=Paenibacillus allorhizosphaerae TaxID=2849866 RepID=A0ABM8VA24_9BACL|nr:hypothetical protein [Paenibacillus allorhizosphaerae]CAG7615069.1 hypothetical protein PAECIP111802_00135 [Paenibacillus allorhizosphaerae]
MKTPWRFGIMLTSLSIFIVGGCTGVKDEAKPEVLKAKTAAAEPLTLSFLQTSAKMTDDEFNQWVVDSVKKKYPNITLTLVREDNPEKLAQLIAIDKLPDIIYAGPVTVAKVVELQAAQDLTSLIKQNNVNLGAPETAGIDIVKQLSDSGKLFALPLAFNFSGNQVAKDSGADVNTVVRQTDEKINKAIEALKKQ